MELEKDDKAREQEQAQQQAQEPEETAVDAPESEDKPEDDESRVEAEAEQQPESEPEPEQAQQQPEESAAEVGEKMLTQSQVNELVGRARQEGRDSALRELYGRYGVSNDDEMNDVFGRGQAYMGLDDEYNATKASMKMLMAENALLKTKIDANRWDDVKLILSGKGYDITPETIEAEIVTHPEWRSGSTPGDGAVSTAAASVDANQQQPPTVLRRLGSEAASKADSDNAETEEDRVRNLFGM